METTYKLNGKPPLMEAEQTTGNTINEENKKIEAQSIDTTADTLKDGNKNKEEVFLRIYDITRGMAKVMSPQILGFQIDGVWHTSIEIYGYEFYFQNQLCVQKAGMTPFNMYTERISLGVTDCSKETLLEFFENARGMWTPDKYDMMENNCNHFTDYLASFLVDKGIPDHILELPKKIKDTEFFKNMMMGRRL